MLDIPVSDAFKNFTEQQVQEFIANAGQIQNAFVSAVWDHLRGMLPVEQQQAWSRRTEATILKDVKMERVADVDDVRVFQCGVAKLNEFAHDLATRIKAALDNSPPDAYPKINFPVMRRDAYMFELWCCVSIMVPTTEAAVQAV